MRYRFLSTAFFFLFCFSHTLWAVPQDQTPGRHFNNDVDPYNTYQWNRLNRNNGKVDRGPWYEWWYYKLVDPKTNRSFFFCYGIVNPWDRENKTGNARAFVNFGDSQQKLILTSHVPVTEFQSSYDYPFTRVGSYIATDRMIAAAFEDQGHTVSWAFSIDKKRDWEAMGWGLRFPKLFNIYWHPAQMDARFSGVITINGKPYFIQNAEGYQDKNWGHAFPKWWFWMAVNAFDHHPDSVFVAGGGDARTQHGLPLPTALLLSLYHDGKLYEFRSSEPQYRFDWKITMGRWQITATNFNYHLKVTAEADPNQMMDLQFQTPDGKIFHDYETLHGAIRVELFERKPFTLNWEKIADLSTQNKAGLELGLDHPYDPAVVITGIHAEK